MVLDLAYNILDFTGKGKIKIPILETLYSSIKKEVAGEAKKEISDKTKKVVFEVGKEILKEGTERLVEEKIKNIHPNGIYEKASYHGTKNNSVKNKAPNKGQEALDNSIAIKDETTRRIGISDGEIVIFDETTKGIFHRHVRSWDELTNKMKAVLKKSGLVNKKGKIIK